MHSPINQATWTKEQKQNEKWWWWDGYGGVGVGSSITIINSLHCNGDGKHTDIIATISYKIYVFLSNASCSSSATLFHSNQKSRMSIFNGNKQSRSYLIHAHTSYLYIVSHSLPIVRLKAIRLVSFSHFNRNLVPFSTFILPKEWISFENVDKLF